MNIDKEITFIAKHYKKGLFSVDPALKRIKKIKQGWWTLPKVAAASFLIVVLGATAAILIRNSYSYKESPLEFLDMDIDLQKNSVRNCFSDAVCISLRFLRVYI